MLNTNILCFAHVQSFINATASFKVLERPQFAILQRALFPAYFGIQTIFPVVLALTYPGSRISTGGLRGVLDEYNRWGVLVPLATAFATGLVNWAYYLPATNAVTAKRRDQGTFREITGLHEKTQYLAFLSLINDRYIGRAAH